MLSKSRQWRRMRHGPIFSQTSFHSAKSLTTELKWTISLYSVSYAPSFSFSFSSLFYFLSFFSFSFFPFSLSLFHSYFYAVQNTELSLSLPVLYAPSFLHTLSRSPPIFISSLQYFSFSSLFSFSFFFSFVRFFVRSKIPQNTLLNKNRFSSPIISGFFRRQIKRDRRNVRSKMRKKTRSSARTDWGFNHHKSCHPRLKIRRYAKLFGTLSRMFVNVSQTRIFLTIWNGQVSTFKLSCMKVHLRYGAIQIIHDTFLTLVWLSPPPL